MLTTDENKVLEEIEDWQHNRLKKSVFSGLGDMIFSPVDRLVGFVINDQFIEQLLNMFQKSSSQLVNTEHIVKKAENAGLPVHHGDDLMSMPIPYLDILARSIFKRNSIYATLQGAGLGSGSYALTFVDLSALYIINLKMIYQIGTCYGFGSDSIQEKEFALHILFIASSSGVRKREKFQNLSKLLDSFIDGSYSKEMSILATHQGIKHFIEREVRSLLRRSLFRRFPVVSIILGSRWNYLYTKDVATYAYMFYRKRFIKEAHRRKEDKLVSD